MSNATNGNSAFYEQLAPDNAAMLLIDHQAGLFLGVHSIDQQILKNNTIALAKTAKVFDLPTVLFTSSRNGPNGPTIPELIELFPDKEIIDRSPINLWNDTKCRAAVEQLGRKKLIMAGITTDVCVTFPAIAAVASGYDVYAVIDASGTWTDTVEMTSMLRMIQAGVMVTNWIAVAAELKQDEEKPATPAMNQVFGERMGLYDFLSDIAAVKAGS